MTKKKRPSVSGKSHRATPKKSTKRYQRPDVKTLSREDLLSAIGPAQASTSGVVDPPCDPGHHHRR